MSSDRVRRRIEFEAARLLRSGRVDDVGAARHAAARKLVRGWVPEEAMPTDQAVLSEAASDFRSRDEGEESEEATALRELLRPLAHVRMTPRSDHPEGDALYHSLQAFELAREAAPHDVELQAAALLHEVGRAADARDPESVTRQLLQGLVSERTLWLIEHLPEELRRRKGTLGGRAVRRLRTAEDGDALATLGRCDDSARVPGGAAPDLESALAAIDRPEEW